MTKFDFSSRTLFSENCATLTVRVADGDKIRFRLSIEHITCSSRDCMERVISAVSGTINGRTFKLWGAIGAMISTFASGMQIGPPTLNE